MAVLEDATLEMQREARRRHQDEQRRKSVPRKSTSVDALEEQRLEVMDVAAREDLHASFLLFGERRRPVLVYLELLQRHGVNLHP